jgi:hypothetical protein
MRHIHYIKLFQFNFFPSPRNLTAALIFSNFTTKCDDLLAVNLTLSASVSTDLLFFFLPTKVHSLEALFNNLFKLSLKFKYYRALFTGTFLFCFKSPAALRSLFNLSMDSRFFLFLIAKRISATLLSCTTKTAVKDYSVFASNLKPKYTVNSIASTSLPVFNLFMTSLLQIRSILLLASLILVYL